MIITRALRDTLDHLQGELRSRFKVSERQAAEMLSNALLNVPVQEALFEDIESSSPGNEEQSDEEQISESQQTQHKPCRPFLGWAVQRELKD